jgi:hypothetical protein
MAPGEALLQVQQALLDRQLPGGVGLRESDRCFIVVPGVRDRLAVASLLERMGMEVSGVNGTVYGHLAGRLLPAPPLLPALVSSSDCCRAAELAAVLMLKRCADCREWFPAESYVWWDRKIGKRSPYCPGCNALASDRGTGRTA